MPLPLPTLGKRTFDQLVTEGQVLLPRLAPSWTDYNTHDPGITLLELFAWLAEAQFYRLDRINPAMYRAFLRLVGIELRGPTVAETIVVASWTGPAGTGVISAGTVVLSTDRAVKFRVQQDTSISRTQLVTTLREGAPDAGAWYLGFDGPLPSTPSPLAIWVSTATPEKDRVVREALIAEWEAAAMDAAEDGTPPPMDWRQHHGAWVVWEYHTGGGSWAALKDVEDETRAVTLTGLVRFSIPNAAPHVAGGLAGSSHASRWFIRCRVISGRYDCPPPDISVLVNALVVRHAVPVPRQRLRPQFSSGRAAQVFQLPDSPVVAPWPTRDDAIEVEVVTAGGPDGEWWRAPDWDRVGSHDRTFVLAPERGQITFGNGRAGRVPPAGAEVWAKYQVGGGPSGNIASGTLKLLEPAQTGMSLTQPFAATGGLPAETIAQGIGRALGSQASPGRLVTLSDFETAALEVPGVPVARAHAIADYDPTMPCFPALGNITVVVVPPCPSSRPEPSAELLCAVARYLERRRTVTTELHVVGPSYVVVSVAAQLHPVAGADTRKLAGMARTALDQFLDPLRGGPDGLGWSVGRDVYRAEIMALLNDLDGVNHVDEVTIMVGDNRGSRCGNVAVCPHGLVASGTHRITIASGSGCQ